MKKLLVFNMITLDGFFAGPHGEIDWHRVDAEFNAFAIDQLKTLGIVIFGRVTYELMASYWPTKGALEDDPIIAGMMNSLPKIVFSKTLKSAGWNNTTLKTNNLEEEISRLKQIPGKDMAIFGSGTIVQALTNAHLIDEYRLMVNPVILGKGKPLFQGVENRLNLTLESTRKFKNGNVLLLYRT